jgi:hypothetical protein
MRALAERSKIRSPNRQSAHRKNRATRRADRIETRCARAQNGTVGDEKRASGTAPSLNAKQIDTTDACLHRFAVSCPIAPAAVEVVIQLDPDRTNRATLHCLILEEIRKIHGEEIARRYEQTAWIGYAGAQLRRDARNAK